jgi:hypothetical protein
MSHTLNRDERIARAAERLVALWKRMAKDRGYPDWTHKGCWYPLGSEKQAKALINAVLRKK